jgi:heptosyltransferase-2
MRTLLVIRMSSLGDVILSTSFLENLPSDIQVDWVISSEFAFVLKGHPRIRHLIEFNKKSGLVGWFRLLRELKSEKYEARVDLHVTLRTRLARLYYALTEWGMSTRWLSISKQRIRFLAYVTLKSFCPIFLRPTPFWMRFAKLAASLNSVGGVNPSLRPPSYLPLLSQLTVRSQEILSSYHLSPKKYYALKPASRWRSKEWGAQKYIELASTIHSQTQAVILLLGRETDEACRQVKEELMRRKVPMVTALHEADFRVTAILIQHSIAYIGGDTGLAHLSEAVGTPSIVIFGPTRPDLGFGPWSRQSTSVYSDVACSPCSKDGKICYRFWNRYGCLKQIEVDRVRAAIP